MQKFETKTEGEGGRRGEEKKTLVDVGSGLKGGEGAVFGNTAEKNDQLFMSAVVNSALVKIRCCTKKSETGGSVVTVPLFNGHRSQSISIQKEKW